MRICEIFTSIQGEGIFAGVPSVFVRLSGCPLHCEFCDSKYSWAESTDVSIGELITELKPLLLSTKHLVVTGGSPLMQLQPLKLFLRDVKTMGSDILIELENECYYSFDNDIDSYIDIWNNSPKLTSSGVDMERAYNKGVLSSYSNNPRVYWKFVVKGEYDIKEIITNYLPYIKSNNIILMPLGISTSELDIHGKFAVQQCIKYGWMYSDRLHIRIWGGQKRGV